MDNTDIVDFKKIVLCYADIGEKKVFKNSMKKLNINKKVHLYYSNKGNIPICALPKLKLVLVSRQGFCHSVLIFLLF